MKNLINLFVVLILLTGFTFTQERPDKSKEMIITPDGKLMSRIDGSITEPNYNLNTLKNNKSENDAPIGIPFNWDPLLYLNSSGSNQINAIAVSGSDIYIGGEFTDAAGNSSSNYIVRYNQKNNTWHPLGSGLNASVHAIAVSGNDVYVGGDFTDAGGNVDADRIARWDGSSWYSLGSENSLDGRVNAIAVNGSNVYAGGFFTNAGGISGANYIARWNGNNWNSMGGQLDDIVRAIAVKGSEVYIGGAFSNNNMAGRAYFVKYNNGVWSGIGTSSPLNDQVYAIEVSDNDLYIGGVFSNAGGNPNADAVAYLDLSIPSADWQPLGNGIVDDQQTFFVYSLALSGDDLYVGGNFTNKNTTFQTYVAHWNGIEWEDLTNYVYVFAECSAVDLSGTDLLVGGFSGFRRWFGAYAEGLYGGVQKTITSGTGPVEFNTSSESTEISIELYSNNNSTGIFNVFCYEHKLLDTTILQLVNHRWIIQQNGIDYNDVTGEIRFKIVDLPDSSGISNPGTGSIQIFHRSTPGRGEFIPKTWYYYYDNSEYVIPFSGTGEFAFGLPNTIDGVISTNEYGSNIKYSDGKTWYMRTDEIFMYFAIEGYTDANDAVNIYLDHSGVSPVNAPSYFYGTQTGTGKDGLNTKLPFGADFFAYVKPAYDEYKHSNQFGGWTDSVANDFIKSYNDPGNVFEFAIPLSSLPVPIYYNNPLLYFNWLGYISNGLSISSRVPSRLNPSGIPNDLVWYNYVYSNSYSFGRESYTHIGPSIPDFGAIDCYGFTFYPQDNTVFINRTNGEWSIENDLFIYNGTLTFQNPDTVNVGSFFIAGVRSAPATINFSYGSSDAPLVTKYRLHEYGDSSVIFMDSGQDVIFPTPPYPIYALFISDKLFQNVVVDNPYNVLLASDMKIKESLTLQSGNIQTDAFPPDTFYVILDTSAVLNSSGGFIQGGLVKYIPFSPGLNIAGDSPDNLVVNFPLGTANGPSPVSVDFSSVTSGGKLTVEVYQNIHPNTINSSETLGRYWRITKDEDLAFTSADITFNYRPEDFNSTTFSEITDEATMVVGKYNTGNWTFPTVSSRIPGGNNDGGSITVSGITSFSDFTLGRTAASLPVELTSFTASIKNNSVQLKWSTATEINNYGFEIERNTPLNPLSRGEAEGRGVWEKIGFVEGGGNSNSIIEYSFTDTKLFGGSKFTYRLKQIDNDGTFSYSDEINVEVVPDKFELSQNYPNPFNPSTSIRYQVSSIAQVTLKVYDVLGNEVATLVNEEKPAGNYEVDFNASQLSSGIYLYKLQTGSFVETKKMILLR